MTPASRTEQIIRKILTARGHAIELTPDLPLGSHGLGLDSIAVVEVLLECERALGISIADELLDRSSVTVGNLLDTARERVLD